MTDKPISAVVWLVRFTNGMTVRRERAAQYYNDDQEAEYEDALHELNRLATQMGIRRIR